LKPRVTRSVGLMGAVKAIEQGEPVALCLGSDPSVLRGEKIKDRVPGAGTDHRSLSRRRQEAGGPICGTVGSESARVGEHHERGEILAQTSEAVRDPGTDTGEAGKHKAGTLHESRGAVNIRLRDHRGQECDVVNTSRQMRQQVAYPLTTLSVLPPFPGAGHDR